MKWEAETMRKMIRYQMDMSLSEQARKDANKLVRRITSSKYEAMQELKKEGRQNNDK